MRKLLSKLWEDDGGFIVSLELLFIAVILVIGIIAGMGNLRVAMITTYSALANAVLALDPGYAISTIVGDTAGSEGTSVTMGTVLSFSTPGGTLEPIFVTNPVPPPFSSQNAYSGLPYIPVP
jgi:hypothetical protein